MPRPKPTPTISEVFTEFLQEQKARLSPKTFRNYENIIGLFETYLEGYWPGHDREEYQRITGGGGGFCDTFGPEDITGGYSEFLGYFIPHKVMCGKETMSAAGTVAKKLATWLAEKKYVEDTSDAAERASDAARDLPAAEDALTLLEDYVEHNRPDDEEYEDEVEDHFWIKKVGPGELWLEALSMHDGVIGPVPVSKEVTDICGEMWDIAGVVVRTKKGWRFLEVWKVSP
jgi:hypothetical protein